MCGRFVALCAERMVGKSFCGMLQSDYRFKGHHCVHHEWLSSFLPPQTINHTRATILELEQASIWVAASDCSGKSVLRSLAVHQSSVSVTGRLIEPSNAGDKQFVTKQVINMIKLVHRTSLLFQVETLAKADLLWPSVIFSGRKPRVSKIKSGRTFP